MENRDPRSLLSKFVLKAGLVCMFWVSGCATYEARPLQAEDRRAAWLSRTVEDEDVAEFVQRLAAEGHPSERPITFDPSDGLTVQEARLFALIYHPDLRLARLQLERSAASAGAAGLWRDPRLSLSLLRISDRVPDRWVVNPSLVFSFPLSGRLRSERDLVAAELRAAEYRVLEAERAVWKDVRVSWARWSAATLRVGVLEDFLERAVQLKNTTSELSRMGEIRPTEAALFKIETLQRQNQLLQERGEQAANEQELRHLLGLAPGAPLSFVPLLEARNPSIAPLADGHPTLARLRASYQAAESRLQREVRKQVPDLSLGPQLEEEAGQTRIGIQGGLPIPIFNANRRAIAEAEVDRELARAAYENAYQDLVAQRAVHEARAAFLAKERETMESELIPLVDESLERALELLSLGEGSALVALESQVRDLDTRLRWLEVRASEVVALSELEVLSGAPVLPQELSPDEMRQGNSR